MKKKIQCDINKYSVISICMQPSLIYSRQLSCFTCKKIHAENTSQHSSQHAGPYGWHHDTTSLEYTNNACIIIHSRSFFFHHTGIKTCDKHKVVTLTGLVRSVLSAVDNVGNLFCLQIRKINYTDFE